MFQRIHDQNIDEGSLSLCLCQDTKEYTLQQNFGERTYVQSEVRVHGSEGTGTGTGTGTRPSLIVNGTVTKKNVQNLYYHNLKAFNL